MAPKDQHHQCPKCPQKFAQLIQLKNHIRTHTGEKPFQCKICDKAFHSKQHLKVCDKAFHVKSILSNHMRIHKQQPESN
ncbi:zinc finger protein 121-like [Anopheles cruzii]|uniref:zinc finger protein 121-like n=1 Tax=Anopheles cruzii TaxID=68878 RepID=UPI0022EC99A7|nr:zinc finger protein 121-like [Anopheles cruzii]